MRIPKPFPPVLFLLAVTLFTSCSNSGTAQTEDNHSSTFETSSSISLSSLSELTYPIVGTGIQTFYSDKGEIEVPSPGADFYDQDAHFPLNSTKYTDNGDGTISDQITGLMWQQDMGVKMTMAEAIEAAQESNLGGYSDWRIPTIKELYSLIQFYGREWQEGDTSGFIKFIDTNYFRQPFGDLTAGERTIDAQTWSQTQYVGLTMKGDTTIFGVNFIDGRIKGYPKYNPQTKAPHKMYFRLVRGNSSYGKNQFNANDDLTISDLATGLMWMSQDDGQGRNWQEALKYADTSNWASYSDWRLPSIKELQSLVDYTRAPDITQSPAIDPLFNLSEILNPGGEKDYPYFWSATTHLTGVTPGEHAAYIAFGRGLGQMNNTQMDVHGAGVQRSDPKNGNASDYPQYFGPQGDVRYVFNHVLLVRDL